MQIARWICFFGLGTLPSLTEQAKASQARFSHATVEQGLSQNTVQAIVQDRAGFIWLGTEEGLNRYDGYSFAIFKHDPMDPGSLPDDVISALFEDSQGRLWVGTEHGLCRFNEQTGLFERFPEIRGRVTGITEGNAGDLWAGSEMSGLFCLHAGSTEFVPSLRLGADIDLSGVGISALLRDKKGRLWIGTRNAGIALYDEIDGRVIRYRHDPARAESLSHDEIWGLAQDRLGQIWVATYGGGLNVLDEANGSFRHYRNHPGDPHGLPTDMLTCVRCDQGGTLWVGTNGSGVLQYEPSEDRFFALAHDPGEASSLSRDVVRTLYDDVQGQLWVGTFMGGVNILKRSSHEFGFFTRATGAASGLRDPAVKAIIEEPDGKLWLGSLQGWVSRFDPATGRFENRLFPSPSPGEISILCFHHDLKGRLWIGTYHGGLALVEGKEDYRTYRHVSGDPKSLGSDDVWAIEDDADGTLWLGTNSGLDHFDPSTGTVSRHLLISATGGLSYSGVRALHRDEDGNLWIGTFEGLHVLRKGADLPVEFRHDDSRPSSLASDSVVSLHEDKRGQLWIGTFGGGLDRLESGGTFVHYRNFESNVIYAIEEDGAGNLWVSTNQGLSCLDPTSGRIQAYDLSNGLQSLQFNLGASYRTRGGRLLFGSTDGFYDFSPSTIVPDSYAPPLVLTSVRVFNEPLKLPATLTQVTLRPQDRVFTVEFAALDFSFPRRNHYEYLMEGFGETWNSLGTRREATFTNLDPGNYLFQVRASNSDGVWNPASTATLRIRILPPFWRTWWFRLLSAGILILGLTGLHRLRVSRLTAKLLERQRTEAILRQAEEKYRQLVEDIQDIIFSTDEQGKVTYISPVAEHVLGYRPAEVIGQPLDRLVAEDDAAAVRDHLCSPGSAESRPLEFRMLSRTGEVRWLRSSTQPIFQDGAQRGMRGVLTDITELKTLELQLRQAQKMEAIGQLAGGVAHDFNNLLTVITGHCLMLLHDVRDESGRLFSSLSEIRNAAQRAASLTQQLLAFSRKQMLQPKEIELGTLVLGMEKMLQRLIGEDVSLEIAVDTTPGFLKADPVQIEQIVLNLAINARDAMPTGGRLRVETSPCELKEASVSAQGRIPAGSYMRLYVSDTGIGMPVNVQSHLFEPFFTTKGVGKGTGLGLSTVYGIVKQSNGFIEVVSSPGKGTRFTLYFPRISAPPASPSVKAPLPGLPTGKGTLLLVEDNDTVRHITKMILEGGGYHVIEAANGDEAMKLFDKNIGSFRLVITDVIMPKMNGRELAENLVARDPAVKVLFMSGYTDESVLNRGRLAPGFVLLQKPFTPLVLLSKVQEAIST